MSRDMGVPLTQMQTGDSVGRQHTSEKALESDFVENNGNGNHNGQYAGAPRKRGFGSKVKRHCARFWWVHIIVFCVVFLIISLSLVYGGMPRIAQQNVDESSLELLDLQFLDPTPDALMVTQKARLHNPSIFTPTLDAFPADSFLVDNKTGQYGVERMVVFEMPQIHSLRPTSDATIALQLCKILSQKAVNAYVSAVLKQEYVTSALVGGTKLHLGALPVTHINYNTTVTYKGLNGLAGFNVTDARVNISAPVGTPNLKAIAFVPNPSILTVMMGNVTLALTVDGVGSVGSATIDNMTLKPGDNHFPMNSIVDNTKILPILKDGFVNLTITGNSSVFNGQHLPYYEEALRSNALHLNLNVGQILKDSA